MRVVFYDCGYPSFGVQYLITALRARGHEVSLFLDHSLSKDYLVRGVFLSLTSAQAVAGIMALRLEVVCVPLHSSVYNDDIKLVQALKRAHPGLIVVCGGSLRAYAMPPNRHCRQNVAIMKHTPSRPMPPCVAFNNIGVAQ